MAGVFINTIMMLLNLLPLLPLDGGRIVESLLPGPLSWKFSQLERFGLPIMLLLLFSGVLGKILWPLVMLVLTLLSGVAGLKQETMNFLLFTLLK
jgi:Zn-dependent protease